MPQSSVFVATLLALGAMLLVGSAAGQGTAREEAALAFAAGDQAYSAGEYLAAARAYENANQLYPDPSITFSIAQAYRRHAFASNDLAWLERAQALYQRYLVEEPSGGRREHAVTHLGNIAILLAERDEDAPEAPPAPPPTELLVTSKTPAATASIDGSPPRPVPVVQHVFPGLHRVIVLAPGFVQSEQEVLAVEGRMSIVPSELAERPGVLRVAAEEGASVWVDARLVGRTPLDAPLPLTPGPHVITVGAAGSRPVSRSVRIERGGDHLVRADLGLSGQRVAAHWTLAGAGALLLAAGATGIVALASEGEIDDARSDLGRGQALTLGDAVRSNDALDRRDGTRDAALGLLGGSLAAGLTGTFLFVFDGPGTPPPAWR